MQHPSRKIALVVTAIATGVALLAAQASAQKPSFEAASIKRNTSATNAIGNRFGPELFSWTNVPLRTLIADIYSVKDYQIIGAPNWVNTDRWDIVARTERAASIQQKNEMAKTLLADRFQLKFRKETRQLPVYSLVAIKNGPKFQRAANDDVPAGLKIARGLITAHKWDVSSLANVLSGQLNMPVLDKVGLKGTYDFRLEWSPVPNEGNFSTQNDSGDDAPLDVTGPSIFTALQEQLGLKLESAKGPVETLVIDSVQKPSEN